MRKNSVHFYLFLVTEKTDKDLILNKIVKSITNFSKYRIIDFKTFFFHQNEVFIGLTRY